MNPDIFIFDDKVRLSNWENFDIPKTNIYVFVDLFNDDNWLKYSKSYTATYKGIKDYLLEFSLITNLAITYKKSGGELYKISPYYIYSLYNNVDDTIMENFPIYSRTKKIVNTSKIIKKYLEVYTTGGQIFKDHKIAYETTTYKIKNELKELSNRITIDSAFYEFDLSNFTEEGTVKKYKDKVYITDNKKFNTLKEAKKYSDNIILLSSVNRYIREKIISKKNYADVDSYQCDDENMKHPVSLTNTIDINPYNVAKLLLDKKTYSCDYKIILELAKISEKLKKKEDIILKYYKVSHGRHYLQNSYLQFFSKKMRKELLSNYRELDMNCSCFSLLKNIGKKYKYNKETPQLDAMIADRKKYREMLSKKTNVPYEGVKEILTAISYGATINLPAFMKIANGNDTKSSFAIMNLDYDKMDIINVVSTNEIKDLLIEIKLLEDFIIKKCKDKNGNIVNYYGDILFSKDENGKSITRGKKIAHIIQSYESMILTEISNMKINNTRLYDIKNAIGLFLHDGIYIHNKILEWYKDNICDVLSNYIEEKIGFKITYELD